MSGFKKSCTKNTILDDSSPVMPPVMSHRKKHSCSLRGLEITEIPLKGCRVQGNTLSLRFFNHERHEKAWRGLAPTTHFLTTKGTKRHEIFLGLWLWRIRLPAKKCNGSVMQEIQSLSAFANDLFRHTTVSRESFSKRSHPSKQQL